MDIMQEKVYSVEIIIKPTGDYIRSQGINLYDQNIASIASLVLLDRFYLLVFGSAKNGLVDSLCIATKFVLYYFWFKHHLS